MCRRPIWPSVMPWRQLFDRLLREAVCRPAFLWPVQPIRPIAILPFRSSSSSSLAIAASSRFSDLLQRCDAGTFKFFLVGRANTVNQRNVVDNIGILCWCFNRQQVRPADFWLSRRFWSGFRVALQPAQALPQGPELPWRVQQGFQPRQGQHPD